MKKMAIFLLNAFFFSSLQAQLFEDRAANMPVASTGNGTMDVESADLDGDGDLDLVLASEARANLIFFNDGAGNFSLDPGRMLPEFNPNDQFPGEDSEDVAIADFDRDGDLDLFFVSEDTPNHELLINDGTGRFTFAGFTFPASTANALAVLDINGDEFPDIIIGNKGKNQLFINNGDLTFTDETDSRWPGNNDHTQDLKLADIDGNGSLDIVEGTEQGGNNIYLNNDGVFSEGNSRLPDFGQPMETRKVTLGDLNGDGQLDIYLANVGWTAGISGRDRLLFNDGTGHFVDVTEEKLPANDGTSLEAIFLDFSGDGHLDIILTQFVNEGQQACFTYLNDGTGTFTENTAEVFPPMSHSRGVGLHAADFNADGYPDVYFANHWQPDGLFFFIPAVRASEKTGEEAGLWLSPNPVSDVLRIEAPGLAAGTWLAILDSSGKQMARLKMEKAEARLDVSSWPAGQYWVQYLLAGAARSGSFAKID